MPTIRDGNQLREILRGSNIEMQNFGIAGDTLYFETDALCLQVGDDRRLRVGVLEVVQVERTTDAIRVYVYPEYG